MTADITGVGLAELLHPPQVQVRAEQIGPGRQGGPLLVVIGLSLIGLALWGWAGGTLGWSVFALAALGAALTTTGVGLAAHTQLDQQPTDSTRSSRLAARVFAKPGVQVPGWAAAVRERRREHRRGVGGDAPEAPPAGQLWPGPACAATRRSGAVLRRCS
jgi:hypothetical protein